MQENSAQRYLEALREMDHNRNGRLDAQEALREMPRLRMLAEIDAIGAERRANLVTYSMPVMAPGGAVPQPTQRLVDRPFTMPDTTLFNREALLLPPARPHAMGRAEAERVVRQAFPRGVEEVTLSDALENSANYSARPARRGEVTVQRRGPTI